MFSGRSERSSVMTRRTHFVRTISVAVVALGLMAQAAQARPFDLPPAGPGTQAAASHPVVMSPHNGPFGVAAEPASYYAPRPGKPVAAAPTVLHLAAVERPATTSVPQSVNWMAVLGGVGIIAMIGGLILVMSRRQPQRPQRPATA
jgi:hypothetical protein